MQQANLKCVMLSKKPYSKSRIMCYMIPFIYTSGQGMVQGQNKICRQLFIAALFIIAKTWKQLKCSSVGEWRNKLWYTQTMEYYSALKINELSSHGKTWTNLKCIL